MKKIFGCKKLFNEKKIKILMKKIFWMKKIFGSKKFVDEKNFLMRGGVGGVGVERGGVGIGGVGRDGVGRDGVRRGGRGGRRLVRAAPLRRRYRAATARLGGETLNPIAPTPTPAAGAERATRAVVVLGACLRRA